MRHSGMFALLLLMACPVPGHAAVLITDQEAKLPPEQGGVSAPTAAGGAGFENDRGTPTRGPDLMVRSPRGVVTSPFPLHVSFAPHNGARIDPSTVTVTLLTRPEVDLTNRVEPYITARGIDFGGAEVPPGRYQVRIDLTDDAGHTGSTVIDLQVQRP